MVEKEDKNIKLNCHRKRTLQFDNRFETISFGIEGDYDTAKLDPEGIMLEAVANLKNMEVTLTQQLDLWEEKVNKSMKLTTPSPEAKKLAGKPTTPENEWADTIRSQITNVEWRPWSSGKPGGSAPVNKLGTVNDFILKNGHIGPKNSFPFEGFRYWKYDAKDDFIQRGKM